MRARYAKPNITYTIGVLQCSDDIVFIVRRNAELGIGIVINNYREGWPDTEILPDRTSICAENPEIETVWRRKYELSPSLAYMNQ